MAISITEQTILASSVDIFEGLSYDNRICHRHQLAVFKKSKLKHMQKVIKFKMARQKMFH